MLKIGSVATSYNATVGIFDSEFSAIEVSLNDRSVREGGTASTGGLIEDLVLGQVAECNLLVQFKRDLTVLDLLCRGVELKINCAATKQTPNERRIGASDAPRSALLSAIPRDHDAIVENKIEKWDRDADVFLLGILKVGTREWRVMTESHRFDNTVKHLLG